MFIIYIVNIIICITGKEVKVGKIIFILFVFIGMMVSYGTEESIEAIQNQNYEKIFNILQIQTTKIIDFSKDQLSSYLE